MIGFSQYITEATHITHLEDSIFEMGFSGLIDSVKALNNTIKTIQGKANSKFNVTVKFDGSPSIVCGVHPITKRFFVATKSFFNKTPKINYTHRDIDNNHENPGLNTVLKDCLDNLSSLNLKGIYQGDLLFTRNSLATETIDGVKYVTFTPNTLTYAVPLHSDIGSQIMRSKIGIVFHTKYHGTDITKLVPSYSLSKDRIYSNANVFVTSAVIKDFSGTVNFTQQESLEIEDSLNSIQSAANKTKDFLNAVATNRQILDYLKMFINNEVRNGNSLLSVDAFEDFVMSKKPEPNPALNYIREHRLSFQYSFLIYARYVDVKLKVLSKLNNVATIPTFKRDSDGAFSVATPEGFVVSDHLSDTIYKLVDRLDFSRLNFLQSKNRANK